ncbi:hypothetical protein DL95DRAFT_400353 [Leptodontidium sp. 2 PMI_412]|nr:hypothetical protein DL95DRAFT_400353 [Leptodontidium sp. 2 PMI_412]
MYPRDLILKPQASTIKIKSIIRDHSWIFLWHKKTHSRPRFKIFSLPGIHVIGEKFSKPSDATGHIGLSRSRPKISVAFVNHHRERIKYLDLDAKWYLFGRNASLSLPPVLALRIAPSSFVLDVCRIGGLVKTGQLVLNVAVESCRRNNLSSSTQQYSIPYNFSSFAISSLGRLKDSSIISSPSGSPHDPSQCQPPHKTLSPSSVQLVAGLAALKFALKAGGTVNVLARTPSKLANFTNQFPNLHVIKGDIRGIPAIKSTVTVNNRVVDVVISAIGMVIERKGLGFESRDPTICEDGTKAILTTLS